MADENVFQVDTRPTKLVVVSSLTRAGNVDDEIREVLGALEDIALTLDTNDAWDGGVEDSIEKLCRRPKPLEYDL